MTRREKRNRFSQWLAELFTSTNARDSRRRILVEPLESRQLLAADGFLPLLGSAGDSGIDDSGALTGEGELVGEGEDADDLVAFAKALTDSGTRFFGAAWCQFCTDQKELFEDGSKFLPFIEVTNSDRSPNQVATDESITEYPTWEFPDGTRLTGVQSLATLASRAGVTIAQSSTPSFDELADVTVGIGSPLHIPIDAYDPNGNPLTITVTSSDSSLVSAELISGNRSVRFTTAGFGDMVFELFENRASDPASRVIDLANDGFYDGVSFHRVINNFVIQGGDPTGTGSGGSTLGDFDDQYHLDLQHNATGILSYAKSSDDTNDSQFFITEGPQRFLDFNHSVFGTQVEGEANREAISNTATTSSDAPLNAVTIESATVFTDTENGVIMLRPTGSGTGSATITVTVSDTEGNSTSQTFQATVVSDTANGAPFLNPVATAQTSVNTPVTVNLTSQDSEGDSPIYSVQALGTTSFGLTVDSATGVATVTPPTGFVGELQFRATVRQSTTPTTSSPDDNQVVSVIVSQSVPTGLDLQAGSDSGTSDSDDITNAQALIFTVSGTETGATVEVRSGGAVVGTAVATGSTTDVTVSNVAGLGQGSTLFTATQTSSGQTSGESPSLAVVLDSTAPSAADLNSVPASAIIDQAISVNLTHSEEGQGLVYSLTGAPTGMVIGAQDGVLDWSPTSAQLGTQTVTLKLTDEAGNETDELISINVIEEPLVKLSLNVVDLGGSPLTTIAAGETFKVQLIAQDLRAGTDATGVFAAYADIQFDSAVIEPIATNPIAFNSDYSNSTSGSVATAGLIDELGGFTSASSLDGNEYVVAEVTFMAKVAGDPNLRTDAADDTPSHHVLIFGESAQVPLSRIDFGASSFAVGANFELAGDAFNFDEDTGPHSLDVLGNDTVTSGAVLTITGVSTPSGGGAVTIATDGKSLSYTPAADFNGAETFTYTAENQSGVDQTATVTLQVTDINDPPAALNDTFSVFRNSTENVLEVLTNDTSGVDASSADSLSVTAVGTGSAGGTIVIGSSGLTLRYTPASDFQGTETFTYTLSDGRGGTDTGTVSVSVDLSNPPPTAQNDSFSIDEDTAQASYDVLTNDTTDDSTETLDIASVGSPSFGGTASVASDGLSILYNPAPNFSGTEIFTYTLRDSGGATSNGLVTFTVNAVNDAPDAVDDSISAFSSEATTTLNVLSNDVNVDTGETLQITAVSQPPSGSGTVAISSDGQSLIYTPPSSAFESNFSFTYTVDDGTGLTDTATINLDVSDFVPRDIGGTLTYGTGTSSSGIAGVAIRLSGRDAAGNAVSHLTSADASGAFNFEALPPGDYTIVRDALPFLHDEGASVSVSSGVSDGDMVSNLVVSGGLRPEFFDIRDFLGSTARNNLMVAVNVDGSQNWVAPSGDWSELSSLSANLVNSTDTLAVNAVNASQQSLSGSIDIASNPRVYVAGNESSMRLLKFVGSVSDAGLTTVSPSTASGEGEGEADTLSAEGESAVDSGLSVPLIESVRREQPADEDLSPTEVIRRLLGSAQTTSDVLSSDAVDTAMASVAPAIQLQLSDDLEGNLTADSDEVLAANDALISQL